MPRYRFKFLLFIRGYDIMMAIPMKWRTPNIMNSEGMKIHVTSVTPKPNEKILRPLFKYFSKDLLFYPQ